MKKTLLTLALALTLLLPMTVKAYELSYDWSQNHGYSYNIPYYSPYNDKMWEVNDGYLLNYTDEEESHYLIKLSKDGKMTVWEKQYSSRELITDCVSTNENYYCIVLNYYNQNSVYKYDRDGKLLDKLLINKDGENQIYGEIFIDNSKIIAVNITKVYNEEENYYTLGIGKIYTVVDKGNLKIEKNENIDEVNKDWFKKLTRKSYYTSALLITPMINNFLEENGNLHIEDFTLLNDNSIILSGYSYIEEEETRRATLIKMDKNGNVKWTKYGKEDEDYYKITARNENELYVVGTKRYYSMEEASMSAQTNTDYESDDTDRIVSYIYEMDGKGNIIKTHNLNEDTENDYAYVTDFKIAKDGIIGLFQYIDEDSNSCMAPSQAQSTLKLLTKPIGQSTTDVMHYCSSSARLHSFKYNFIYEINKEDSKYGSVTVPDRSRGNKEVEVEVNAKEGYKVEKIVLIYEDGTETTVYDNKFIMPYENVIVKPYFVDNNVILSGPANLDIENPPTGITSTVLATSAIALTSGGGLHIAKKKKIFKNFKK